MKENEETKKKNRFIKTAAFLFLVAAGVLIFSIAAASGGMERFGFRAVRREGSRLEFKADNDTEEGFHHAVTIYTEDGITSVRFSGRITVEGAARLLITSARDDEIIFEKSYSDMRNEPIDLEIDDLHPYAYYTIKFTSDSAKKGKLILTSDQTLAKHPEPPDRPVRPTND